MPISNIDSSEIRILVTFLVVLLGVPLIFAFALSEFSVYQYYDDLNALVVLLVLATSGFLLRGAFFQSGATAPPSLSPEDYGTSDAEGTEDEGTGTTDGTEEEKEEDGDGDGDEEDGTEGTEDESKPPCEKEKAEVEKWRERLQRDLALLAANPSADQAAILNDSIDNDRTALDEAEVKLSSLCGDRCPGSILLWQHSIRDASTSSWLEPAGCFSDRQEEEKGDLHLRGLHALGRLRAHRRGGARLA